MNTKNVPLIIAVALPVIFIVIVALFVYIPKANLSPKYNFIYTSRDYTFYGAYKNDFAIVNGKITLKPNPEVIDAKNMSDMPTLYVYNVTDDTSRTITFAEAKELMLDPGPSSPDGYTVEYDYGHDGIFEIFGSNGNNRGAFISKGGAKKKVMIGSADRYYSDSFRLLGWIK